MLLDLSVFGSRLLDSSIHLLIAMIQESDTSTAVRVALGETHIVAENKEFLKANGVELNAFDTRVRLVKAYCDM